MKRNSYAGVKYIKSHSKCELCGKDADCVHHLLPVTLGGSDEDFNLMSLCDDCHNLIHEKSFSKSTLQRIGKYRMNELKKQYGYENCDKLREELNRYKELYEHYHKQYEICRSQLSNLSYELECCDRYKKRCDEYKEKYEHYYEQYEYYQKMFDNQLCFSGRVVDDLCKWVIENTRLTKENIELRNDIMKLKQENTKLRNEINKLNDYSNKMKNNKKSKHLLINKILRRKIK